MARPLIHALIAVLSIGISCVSEAAKVGSRSSSAATSTVGKKVVTREEVATEPGKSASVRIHSGSASASGGSGSPAAAGAAAGAAVGTAAAQVAAEEKQQS